MATGKALRWGYAWYVQGIARTAFLKQHSSNHQSLSFSECVFLENIYQYLTLYTDMSFRNSMIFLNHKYLILIK